MLRSKYINIFVHATEYTYTCTSVHVKYRAKGVWINDRHVFVRKAPMAGDGHGIYTTNLLHIPQDPGTVYLPTFLVEFYGQMWVNALYMDPMDILYRFILSNISILYKSITSLLLEKKHVGHTNNECSFNNLVICFWAYKYIKYASFTTSKKYSLFQL